MRWTFLSSALVFLNLCAMCPAQPQTPVFVKSGDAYAAEALVFERFDTIYRMKADGTGEAVQHLRARIQSEGAVRQFGVLSVSYNGENSRGLVEHVRVYKPDGTSVETPGSEAMELPAPITRELRCTAI